MKSIIFLFLIYCSVVFAQKDCQIPSKNYPPITDLETSTFRGFMGGKYKNGSNLLTGNYLNDALALSAQIKTLDISGNQNKNGKIVMVGIGASNPRTEFAAFQRQYDTFTNKNQNLVLVNTCIGGQGVQKMNISTDNYWVQAQKTFDSVNVDFKQVQIAWIETDNTQNGDTLFPRAALSLIQDLRQLLITMKVKFPNLKLCYFSARAYAGWASTGLGKGLAHPRDYYNGWAIKWLIDSATTQNPNFKYMGNQSIIPMPLYATYNWTNAEQVRKDGFYINCTNDIGNDGLHLSANGEMKLGNLMFNFFKSDTSSASWFVKTNAVGNINSSLKSNILIYPNPSSGEFHIKNNSSNHLNFNVFNFLGQSIYFIKINPNEYLTIKTDSWNKGIYWLKDINGSYFKLIVK
ncbi:MAG: T9SS type A sorting domain-containing protein [Bacteroidetes bacterium]|nr:T9SS type A sorting domain-containing protein [Bacteroidota bacterium]